MLMSFYVRIDTREHPSSKHSSPLQQYKTSGVVSESATVLAPLFGVRYKRYALQPNRYVVGPSFVFGVCVSDTGVGSAVPLQRRLFVGFLSDS